MLKNSQVPDGFQGEVFMGNIWGVKGCDFLQIGWW